MKRKHLYLALGAAGVAAAVAQLMPAPSSSSAASAPRPAEVSKAEKALAASERFASLPSREAIGKSQGELFGPRSWAPVLTPAAARAAAPVVERPVAPPVPYRIAGQVAGEDGSRVVLAKDDRIFEAREGDVLDGGFRVEKITPHSITFAYVPLGLTQEVPVIGAGLDLPSPARAVAAVAPSAAPAAQPAPQAPAAPDASAHLRFEGPQQVRAGTPFDVALKLTSAQPVRALPMQLSFDAKRLEPVAVRAGDLFAGGSFTYRVNPKGSIFVGASGSGRAASDTDFLIVTFRPIASGPAELKVSSLLLQGVAGAAIAHEPPQAFRAAITQ